MEDEIVMLESYFCKPGEFSKEINIASSEFTLKINLSLKIFDQEYTVNFILRIQSDDLKWNFVENQNNLSLQCINIKRETLLTFKKLVIQEIDVLFKEKNLSLFNICTWISDNLPNYLKKALEEKCTTSDTAEVKHVVKQCKELTPEKPTCKLYAIILIQLDHIRSRKRYLKFLQSTSRLLHISIELLEFRKKILLKVIGNSDIAIKNFIKSLKTTLVDIDSNGQPLSLIHI